MESSSEIDDPPVCAKCGREMIRLFLRDMAEVPRKVSVYRCSACTLIRTIPGGLDEHLG